MTSKTRQCRTCGSWNTEIKGNVNACKRCLSMELLGEIKNEHERSR